MRPSEPAAGASWTGCSPTCRAVGPARARWPRCAPASAARPGAGAPLLAEEKAALAASVRDSFRPRPPAVPPPVVPAGPPADLFFPPAAGGIGIRYTIGRDSRCDLLIEDTSVSRWHARLERAVGRWILTDLGSTNGTRLNGWRVHDPVPVQPGDQVSFGSARFVFRADRQGGAWPVPPGEAASGLAAPGQAAPGQAARRARLRRAGSRRARPRRASLARVRLKSGQ